MSGATPSNFARLVAGAERYRSTPDRYWLTRHYVVLSTLVTVLISLLAPGSLNARALDAAGPLAGLFVPCLIVISVASLFESFVTAFVPHRSCEWLRRRRHLLLMSIALGQLCLAYIVVVYAPSNWAIVLRFSLDATVASSVAYLDLFARHREAHTE